MALLSPKRLNILIILSRTEAQIAPECKREQLDGD